MQCVLDEEDYNTAVKAMHSQLVEVYNHGRAIKLA
jgi:aspartate kinase